jgi:type IV secretion system protein VirB10
MEKAKLDADIDLYKQRRARALASPLVFAAAPEVVATAPAAIGAEPEAAVAEAAIPKAPALPVKEPAAPKHVIREGTIVEATLVNRLDSTFSGPVIVQVSNDVPTADRLGVLIPKGSRILGSAAAVNNLGQTRMAVTFHRMIRTDNVAVDLTKFPGLNQIGETGLKDKVNRHYLQIFGASIALGVIGALAQNTARYGYDMDGGDLARQGFGVGMSRSAEQVLNRFLNIPPTVTIREGNRVKVYIMADLAVPPYEGTE